MRTPVDIVVSRASARAIAAVERAGGSVTTRFYSKLAIPRILRGETSAIASVDAIGGPLEAVLPMSRLVRDPANPRLQLRKPDLPPYPYRLPDPAGRRDREYYRNPANRGYLVHKVKPGEGPSLFFRPPSKMSDAEAEAERKKKAMEKARDENRLF